MTSDEPATAAPPAAADGKPKGKAPRRALGEDKAARAKRDPSRKRGPPRPHRKLAQDVLDSRLSKLRKRIERASAQLADAKRHIEAYDKELEYRAEDKGGEPAE